MRISVKLFLLTIFLSFFQMNTTNATVHIPSTNHVVTEKVEMELSKEELKKQKKDRKKLKRRLIWLGIGLGLSILANLYFGAGLLIILMVRYLFGGYPDFLMTVIFTSGFFISLALLIFLSILIIKNKEKNKSRIKNEEKELK